MYGEVLSQRNLQEDSAVAFTAAGDLPRALESYKAAGHWQMALTLAGVPSCCSKVPLLLLSPSAPASAVTKCPSLCC